MGNLSLENNHRSYSRKPIFNQNNSYYHDQTSRSLSPHLLKTSRSNIYKSTISRRDNRLNISTQRSRGSNRVYLNPALVKSVIKDTSNTDIVRGQNKRLRKSPNSNMTSSLIIPSKTFNQTRQFFPSKKVYEEKTFQQSSPTKEGRREKNGVNFQQDFQKQNSKNVTSRSSNMKSPQAFINSPFSKPDVNLAKFLISGCNSSRNYGADGHILPLGFQQNCHHHQYFHDLSQKEKMMFCDNAPTERKRNRAQQPSQQIISEKKIGSRARPDVEGDFNYETGKKIAYPPSLHNQNREKCQQIIKRVRNFNEFLNQIKSKIKKEYSNITSNHNTIENSMSEHQQSFNTRSPNTSVEQRHSSSLITQMQESKNNYSKSITLALRLENQKIQLEKYRKLVERELSKQHSIESIEIQSKDKQKIITINFDKPGQSEANSQKTKNTKNEPKGQIESSFKKTYKLGKVKDVKKSSTKGQVENEKDSEKMQKRMSKINTLFSKMQGINQAQINSYKQISQIIKDQESADSTV